MKTVLSNTHVSPMQKKKTMKTFIWSVLVYDCKAWAINKDIQRRQSHGNVVLERGTDDTMDGKEDK